MCFYFCSSEAGQSVQEGMFLWCLPRGGMQGANEKSQSASWEILVLQWERVMTWLSIEKA